MASSPLQQRASPLLVSEVEHEIERDFEPVGNFMLVRLERQVGRDHSNHRSNDEAGHRPIFFDRPDDIDLVRIEQDFFPGFAKSSSDGVLAGLEAAAGKGDLTCMSAQMLAADGENDSGLRPIGDGDQDSRRHRRIGP